MANDALPEDVFFERPKTAEEKQQEYKKNAPSPLPEGTFFERPKAEKPPVSDLSDAGMGAASGLTKGVIGLPGMVGNLRDLASLAALKGPAYIESKITGKPQEDIEQRALQSRAKYQKEDQILPNVLDMAPTSQEMVSTATKYLPAIKPWTDYEPQTGPGRITQGTMEFLPSAMVGPGTAGTKLISGIGGGVAGQSAKEIARNMGATPGWQTGLEILGSVAGGLTAPNLAAAVARPFGYVGKEAPETAKRLAGQIYRESVDNPQATINELGTRINAIATNPEAFVGGVNFTPAQILKSGQLKDLENQIGKLADSEAKRQLEAQLANAESTLKRQAQGTASLAEGNIPKVDVSSAINLSGVNPQNAASVAARSAFDALEEAKDKIAKQAWENPLISQADMYRGKVVSKLDDYLKSLTPTDFDRISPDIKRRIKALSSMEGQTTVPLLEMQAIRSMVLDESRSAFANNKASLGVIHSKLGKELADIIKDGKNIRFGDTTGRARTAWENAVAATRDYYDTFRPDFLEKLVKSDASQAPKISHEAFFDRMLSGPNSVQNLRQVRSAIGPSIDNHISNWVIGDLTNNGNANIKNSQIARYISDPKNAAIIDEVPGLRNRISNLVQKVGESEQAAKLRTVSELYNSAADSGNPQTISDFLKANKESIKLLFADPAEKRFIDALYNTSTLLAPADRGVASYSKTLNALQNGRMIDILLGGKFGFLSDVAIAEALTRGASALTGVPGLSGLGALAATASKGVSRSQPVSAISQKISSLMFGDIQNLTIKQLQEMAKDPVTARLLMSKPSPEAAMNFHKRLISTGLGLQNVEALGESPDKKQNIRTLDIGGQRTVRASGGRISTSSLGDKLVLAAERSKRENSKATEPLLNVNDESIAKALEIANRNL